MTRYTPGEMAAPHARLAHQANAGVAALDTTFTLHSRASSTKKIYLDFNGYTEAAGDAWASQGIPAGTFGGFSMDGAGSPGFTQTELDYVTQVWTIVSEKYSPFDVDVTTEDPGDDALTRTSAGDNTYGSHVVFTDDQNARGSVCPVNGCAGIAFIGVFNLVVPPNPNYKPAWVYTTLNFGSGDVQQTAGQAANSAAHEIGHNLGLDHDSTTALGDGNYYDGHHDWAPIMGSSNRAVQQFNNGGYPNALTSSGQVDPGTNTVDPDDFKVITETGLSYRPDAEGGSLGAQSSYTVDGVITTDADSDTFTVDRSACTGDLTVNATGIGLGQALDIQLTVSGPGVAGTVFNPDSAGVSGVPNTPTGMDASGTISSAAAGTWTVKVEGTGDATNSYSGYGSVGQYHLTITGCTASGNAPGQPATVGTTPGIHATTGTVSWTAPSDDGGSAITGYTVTGLPDGQHTVSASTFSYPATGLTPGVTYDVAVAAFNAVGTGTAKHASLRVSTWAPPLGPTVSVTTSTNQATVGWTAPANPGQATPAGWHVILRDSNLNQIGSAFDTSNPSSPGVIITASPGSYSVVVYQKVTSDDGSQSSTTPKYFTIAATIPSAPKIGKPSSGATGGAITAVSRWAAPTTNGGSPIKGYRVIATRYTASGAPISSSFSKLLSPSARTYTFTLKAGRYKFRVVAYNAVGRSPYSAFSGFVVAR